MKQVTSWQWQEYWEMNLICYGKNEVHGRKSFVMANRWMHMNEIFKQQIKLYEQSYEIWYAFYH
jgi:hypothetical protein